MDPRGRKNETGKSPHGRPQQEVSSPVKVSRRELLAAEIYTLFGSWDCDGFCRGNSLKIMAEMRALDGRVDFSRLLTTFGDFHEFSECDQVATRNVIKWPLGM